jgi:hypothetical protein
MPERVEKTPFASGDASSSLDIDLYLVNSRVIIGAVDDLDLSGQNNGSTDRSTRGTANNGLTLNNEIGAR